MGTIEQGLPERKVLSFAELEAAEQVVPADILASLTDYADGGWSIRGDVVTSVIDRCGLSEAELRELADAANRGIEVQTRNGTHATAGTVAREQGEYQQVVSHIESQLSNQ